MVILGLRTPAHTQQMSAFTLPKLTMNFFNEVFWMSSRTVSMRQYLSGFSYVCHWPAELSFSFEGEGFPTLHGELSPLRRLLWSGRGGLGGDGPVLDF